MTYAKPLPPVTVDSAAYWQGAADGRLLLSRCNVCGTIMFYPRTTCTNCMSTDLGWIEASGRGSIYSYTVCYRAPDATFRPDVPYVIALIDLDEGPRMMSNITGCDPADVAIGMAVEVWFDPATEAVAIPKFRPAGAPS